MTLMRCVTRRNDLTGGGNNRSSLHQSSAPPTERNVLSGIDDATFALLQVGIVRHDMHSAVTATEECIQEPADDC